MSSNFWLKFSKRKVNFGSVPRAGPHPVLVFACAYISAEDVSPETTRRAAKMPAKAIPVVIRVLPIGAVWLPTPSAPEKMVRIADKTLVINSRPLHLSVSP